MVSFKKRVSKGSRFNQIYIPKEMEKVIEVGDLVQVKLLEKPLKIYYKNQKRLTDFKGYIIKEIFHILEKFNEIKIVFIVGSFLNEKIYNDIDVIIITDYYGESLEKSVEENLSKKLNQKFHILSFTEEKLKILIEKNPLIRSMFYNYVSNKKIDLNYKKTLDWNHIKFLLMMPEDLLELKLPSKIFSDNIRRLIAIERFINSKESSGIIIANIMKKEMPKNLFYKIRNNESINDNEIKILRKIIKVKLKNIKSSEDG